VVQVACLSPNASALRSSSSHGVGWQLAPVGGAVRASLSSVDARASPQAGSDHAMAALMATARAGLCPASASASFLGGADPDTGKGAGLQLSPGETAPLYLHLISPALSRDSRDGISGALTADTPSVRSPLGGSVASALGRDHGVAPVAASPPGQLDLLHPGGLLEHILAPPSASATSTPKPQQRSKKGSQPRPPPSPSSSLGEKLMPSTTPSQKNGALVMSDPSVDLVVAWQIQPGHRGGQQVRDIQSRNYLHLSILASRRHSLSI
jgi:hypothetical protein